MDVRWQRGTRSLRSVTASDPGAWQSAPNSTSHWGVMANFMGQLGYAIVSSFFVKHHSRCHNEFLMKFIFKSWSNVEWSRLPPLIWVGRIQSAEGLKRKDWGLQRKKEFDHQTAFGLEMAILNLPGVSNLPHWPANFTLVPQITWTNSLK